MKRSVFSILFGSLLLALPALAGDPSQPEAWDTGGGSYEADPADGDAVGQGDDHFRAMKREVRDRLEVEHHFGTATGDDTGLHRLGSGRCFYQSAAPTALEQADHDNDGGGPGDTTLANQDYQSQEIKGLGRCWVDSDTQELYAYGTTEIEDSGAASGWFPVALGQANLLYNGSFEMSAAGAASPSIPVGWANDGLATTATQDTGTSEGDGFAFNGIANSVNDALTQTLDGLKPSTTYVVYGRVAPQVTTCSIRTTSGGTNADVTSASGGGAWETLLDTFVTDAATPPTDVVVRLESDGAASDCDWDHISVVEYSQRRRLPNRIADTDCVNWTNNEADTITARNNLEVRVQIPWPKSVINVWVHTNAIVKAGAVVNEADIAIMENIDAAGAAEVAVGAVGGTGGGFSIDDYVTLVARWMRVNPTPGSEYVYTMVAGVGSVFLDGDAAIDHCIFLEAYPL
jgi:hypothetical protein